MVFKKILKIFASSIVNLPVGVFLLSAFFMAGQNVVQTFAVADMTAFDNLEPQPMDYFWELNIHQAPVDKSKIRYYADYYEHILRVFPSLWEAYGVLGYCYHYLNDDPKAVKFFKIAIRHYPDYFWNYYDLAIIYINESRYPQASGLLQKAVDADPMTSLKKMFASLMVYFPLIKAGGKKVFVDTARHYNEAHQSSFVLLQILNHAPNSQEVQDMMRKFNPEIYAF